MKVKKKERYEIMKYFGQMIKLKKKIKLKCINGLVINKIEYTDTNF